MISERLPASLNQETREALNFFVMDFASHPGITLILIDRLTIQLVCLFDVYLLVPFHLMTKFSVKVNDITASNAFSH